MKKKIMAAVMTAAMVAGLAGATSVYAAEDTITVGFSQVGAESDWRTANTESMKSTFSEENGYELIFDDAQQKQENQLTAIRNFIQQEVDYILLAPVTEPDGIQFFRKQRMPESRLSLLTVWLMFLMTAFILHGSEQTLFWRVVKQQNG